MGTIESLLHPGVENAIPRRDLMALTGLSDRALRLMIEAERRAGALILSDNQNGYYLAVDRSDAQRFAQSMKHRAGEIVKTAEAIEKAVGN